VRTLCESRAWRPGEGNWAHRFHQALYGFVAHLRHSRRGGSSPRSANHWRRKTKSPASFSRCVTTFIRQSNRAMQTESHAVHFAHDQSLGLGVINAARRAHQATRISSPTRIHCIVEVRRAGVRAQRCRAKWKARRILSPHFQIRGDDQVQVHGPGCNWRHGLRTAYDDIFCASLFSSRHKSRKSSTVGSRDSNSLDGDHPP